MALPRDTYREFEDIVGPENISEEPAVLDGYIFQRLVILQRPKKEDRFWTRPEIAVLPGSTEEVQAIIKLCNRRGLRSKASSTGYGASNCPGTKGVVFMDMRRMNRILEIDEKNMFVVVEPYVSFAQVQAEVMRRGLNCHVIGAGSQVSVLASHTSVVGNNTQAISHGHSARNLLGVEWVLPTGEVLRLGSPGSGLGWFTGDGPGPSMRGIMRGALGASGGLGVFTKCASHLHPWPGPRKMEVEGVSPEYEGKLPPLFEYHIIEFPTWEQYGDAQYKIGEAGIGFAIHKTGGPGSHGACVTASNDEYYEKRQAGELEIPRISFSMVMAAQSPAEHDYQVKTLDRILEETGGTISPLGEEPTFKKRDYLNQLMGCFIPRLAFRLTGTFDVDGMLGIDTLEHGALGLKVDADHRDKYAEMGIIMDDGTLNSWAVPFEGGHLGLFECGHQYNPLDDESVKGMGDMAHEGVEICLEKPFALGWSFFGHRIIGAACGNYHEWMREIKRVFDPNTASDPTGYISAEEG